MTGAARDPAGEVIRDVLRRWWPRLWPAIALSVVVTCAVRPLWRRSDPRLAARVAVLEALRSGSELDPWGEPWVRPESPAWRGWLSKGPDRTYDPARAGDEVWVGDLTRRDEAARELERRLPAAYREVWKFPWLGWKLVLGLLLADALLRRAARSRFERAGLLVLAGAGTAAISLILGATLAGGLAPPHPTVELPGPFQPRLLESALVLGATVALVLWLRAREGDGEPAPDPGAGGAGSGSPEREGTQGGPPPG